MPDEAIGRKVILEGVRLFKITSVKHGIVFQWSHFDWSSKHLISTTKSRGMMHFMSYLERSFTDISDALS